MWSLPVPIPDNPLRYTLVYAIALDDGLALVDTGWLADESWRGLKDALGATGHEPGDVRAILLTHSHSDHHGLTSLVRDASGAWVGMHPAEADVLARVGAQDGLGTRQRDWLRMRGAPEPDIWELQRSLRPMGHIQDTLLEPDGLVRDGDRPLAERADLRAIWTPGHTEGHLCFVLEDERVLLSGDHLLPRITPNISRAPGADDDAIGTYLRSLAESADIKADEVLPAHEYRFGDLPQRVAAIRSHHDNRLHEIEQAVGAEPGCDTWTVAQNISWSRGWENAHGIMRQTAVSETYTHLRHLEVVGRVSRRPGGSDAWWIVS